MENSTSQLPATEPGLYLIPTPVGNLEDITIRSVRLLKSVDILLAEDTRTSRVLLSHLGISRAISAYHMHNEHATTAKWVQAIENGESVGMISDAGTPGISDPAFLLVRACIQAGLPVSCLPGPTALIPALVMSGLPIDRFAFEGFLPVKKGRQKRWESLALETRTLAFYESPHRIQKFTDEVINYLGPDTQMCICREISKKFETCIRGTAEDVKKQIQEEPPRGEMVVILRKTENSSSGES